MAENKAAVRDLTVKEGFQLSKFLVKWEMILVYILILINLILAAARPGLYFNIGTIQSIIQSGLDLSPMVMGMVFVLMLGDIDVSIASNMVLSGMTTGLLYQNGAPAVVAVLAGILTGAVCGAFNGILVGYVKMPAVIVTISTSMLFRGIVEIILDVNSLKNFPPFYNAIGWRNWWIFPICMVLYIIITVIFYFVLHRSTFGRKLYIVGNNPVTAEYSGIRVERVKLIVFILMGVMAGVGSIFFVGRMGGGLSSSMGTGYEMDTIAICVLGGVSTNGGKGKVYGPFISTFIMAFLLYTLGLIGVDANTRKIVTGIVLLIAVLIPSVNRQLIADVKLKVLYKNNKNIEALNIKTAAEVKELKAEIARLKKTGDPDGKIRKAEERIASLQNTCKEKTAQMKAELEENARKNKERFS